MSKSTPDEVIYPTRGELLDAEEIADLQISLSSLKEEKPQGVTWRFKDERLKIAASWRRRWRKNEEWLHVEQKTLRN